MQTEMIQNRYSLEEEIANTATHGAGILLSIAALAILVAFSSANGDVWHITSTSIYGATLILLYTASSLYHGIPYSKAKQVLRKLDHAAIFLLIAGTYTPFLLVNLRGPWGWTLFGLVWGVAIFGVVLEMASNKRYKRLSVSLYLSLGWIILIAVKPMLTSVEIRGLILLLTGGLCYSLGVIFYIWKRLAYNHTIWHLFVLAGSVFHFFSVLLYVI
jgi:hemolysin III